MTKKINRKYVIEVDDEDRSIKITDNEGKEFILKSVALFGADAETKECYIQMFGASADAAWAYGRGFVISHSPEGGRELKNFYKQCAAHICFAIDPMSFKNTVGAEEVLNKWESQDQTKWALWDTEDVLIDKEKSEKRAKKLLEAVKTPNKDEDSEKWN